MILAYLADDHEIENMEALQEAKNEFILILANTAANLDAERTTGVVAERRRTQFAHPTDPTKFVEYDVVIYIDPVRCIFV